MICKYAAELKEENIKIKSLTEDNYYLVNDFYCGNDDIDEFLKKKALEDTLVKTHLIIDETDNTLLSFFSISASGISFNLSFDKDSVRSTLTRFNIPAVAINYFAIDKNFQHKFYDEDAKAQKEQYFLSDLLFEKILEFILQLKESIGFNKIILYSVPKSEKVPEPLDIYSRFGFQSFKEFMEPDTKRYLDGCIPLYIDAF